MKKLKALILWFIAAILIFIIALVWIFAFETNAYDRAKYPQVEYVGLSYPTRPHQIAQFHRYYLTNDDVESVLSHYISAGFEITVHQTDETQWYLMGYERLTLFPESPHYRYPELDDICLLEWEQCAAIIVVDMSQSNFDSISLLFPPQPYAGIDDKMIDELGQNEGILIIYVHWRFVF